MAQPSWLKKYLTMKPEVTKLFETIEAYHDYCRFELLPFDPAAVHNKRNKQWKEYQRSLENK